MHASRGTLLLLLVLGVIAVTACSSDDESTAEPTPTTGEPTATTAEPTTTAPDPDDNDQAGVGVPDRAPDVVGIVAMNGAFGPGAHLAPASASDSYFEGMGLLGGDPAIVDADSGASLTTADLVDGARVEVWVAGACAESYPVQCPIQTLRVSLPSS